MIRTKIFSFMMMMLMCGYWGNFLFADGNIEDLKQINKRFELRIDE